jgi:hypothetical protein
MNHADHAFWLGIGASNLVLHFQYTGEKLSTEERGILPDRCVILPIPIDTQPRNYSRTEAKRQLGVPPDCTLLISVAGRHKFGSAAGLSFFDTIVSPVRQHDQVYCLIVGPNPNGVWQEIETSSGGRIRALGRRDDVQIIYQAADVYVDSYPFGSSTSMLEAMNYATPALSLAPESLRADVLFTDHPSIPNELYRTTSLAEFHSRLHLLITDRVYRQHVGNEVARLVSDFHDGTGWQAALERVYAKAQTTEPALPDVTETPSIGDRELMVLATHQAAALAGTPAVVTQRHIRLLPRLARWRLWTELALHHGLRDPHNLFPE